MKACTKNLFFAAAMGCAAVTSAQAATCSYAGHSATASICVNAGLFNAGSNSNTAFNLGSFSSGASDVAPTLFSRLGNALPINASKSFADYISFTIAPSSSPTDFWLTNPFNISNYSFSIFNVTAPSTAIGTATGLAHLVVNPLAAGSYFALITGDLNPSRLFGTYAFHLATAAAPVPLPPAVWLLGAGLVGLFAMARRRKSLPAYV